MPREYGHIKLHQVGTVQFLGRERMIRICEPVLGGGGFGEMLQTIFYSSAKNEKNLNVLKGFIRVPPPQIAALWQKKLYQSSIPSHKSVIVPLQMKPVSLSKLDTDQCYHISIYVHDNGLAVIKPITRLGFDKWLMTLILLVN